MRYTKYIDEHIKSFDGKIVVITGANSGIGFTLAKQILYKGGHVVMACRSIERAKKAKESLLEEFPSGVVDILQYDQSSLESIEAFASELQKKYPSIYGFVFNAGIYHPKKGLKSDLGVPITFATNYLGAYYLTRLLKDYFKSNCERVLYVTSLAQAAGKYKDIKKTVDKHPDGTKAYNVSKRCDISLAVKLNDEIGGCTKIVLSHPGITRTNILASKTTSFAHWFTKIANAWTTIFTNKTEKSSLTSLRALSDDNDNLDMYCPRGFLHVIGYPKIKKITPDKYASDSLYQYSNYLIASKH